jgi:hypothetical protein
MNGETLVGKQLFSFFQMAQAWVTQARVRVARGGARLSNNPPAVPQASLILEVETAL